MAVKQGKRRITIVLSDELFEKIEKHCSESGISKSAYLSLLAAKDLEDTKKYLEEFKNELEGLIARLYLNEEKQE